MLTFGKNKGMINLLAFNFLHGIIEVETRNYDEMNVAVETYAMSQNDRMTTQLPTQL